MIEQNELIGIILVLLIKDMYTKVKSLFRLIINKLFKRK